MFSENNSLLVQCEVSDSGERFSSMSNINALGCWRTASVVSLNCFKINKHRKYLTKICNLCLGYWDLPGRTNLHFFVMQTSHCVLSTADWAATDVPKGKRTQDGALPAGADYDGHKRFIEPESPNQEEVGDCWAVYYRVPCEPSVGVYVPDFGLHLRITCAF